MRCESAFRKGKSALGGFSKEVFLQTDACVRAAGDGVEDTF